MTVRALLFDFDGTLADSFGAITASTNYVRSHFDLPPLAEAEVREYVGHGLHRLLDRLVPGAETQRVVALYREHHPTVMFEGTTLFPGVRDTLATLKAQGRAMAVCSNKAVQITKALVKGMSLDKYFPVVLGPEDVEAPKPHPAMLLEALRRLEVSKDQAIYIGDMAIDVRTARAAGMPVWIMPGGAAGDEPVQNTTPDLVLRDFSQILELLENND